MERVKGDINIFVQSSSIFVIQNFVFFFSKGSKTIKCVKILKLVSKAQDVIFKARVKNVLKRKFKA